jgi:hypothetical protein
LQIAAAVARPGHSSFDACIKIFAANEFPSDAGLRAGVCDVNRRERSPERYPDCKPAFGGERLGLIGKRSISS